MRSMHLALAAVVGIVFSGAPAFLLAQRRAETGFLDRSIELNGQTYRYQVYVPFEYRTTNRGR
jgi:hypothetical protein